MTRRLIALLLALAVATSVAACGRKGPPDAPPGKEDEFPRRYPSG
jgi:predicted small lipoprotein YifL